MLSVSTQIAKEDDISLFLRMLQSVSFADEIVIFNMERDEAELKKLTAHVRPRIVNIRTPKVVEQIRSRQIKEAKGDWVLIMDYDEVVTPELKNEIQSNISNLTSDISAYRIPRRNFSLGFPISHGGFGDDYVHRVFRKSAFRDWPSDIHSTPVVEGEVGTLKYPMEHHKDASLSQMVEKTNRYSDIEAQQFLEGGLPPVTPFTLIRKTGMEIFRRYFLKKGFLDGRIGVIQAIYQGFSVFISYSKLFELQQKGKSK